MAGETVGLGVAFAGVNKSSSSVSVYAGATGAKAARGVVLLVLFEADRDERGVSYEFADDDEMESGSCSGELSRYVFLSMKDLRTCWASAS